ncbi:GNAT family N-acetyltransferase [Sphingomonas sp. YR710]|jgi:putative hemolysin|uniref:GNAT family N-acetyltransferase n=1 Tax=Sphingomonas sp. YR710 TaxID=1882773 RepID=UPI00210CB373|nr:GNAT family N-acyltransferase [Sphingomonas sp. YR710]
MMIELEQLPRERMLTVRLAQDARDIAAAQRLRYRIFCEAMGASLHSEQAGLDIDRYDAYCDHLLVEDLAARGSPVVGTYRLLRQGVAERHFGFYSADEFDLDPIIAHARRERMELLELGRSCVDPAYRDAGTIQMLWRGIADYLRRHRIGFMFGCASFHGTDPEAHAAGLSLLAHDHLAPVELRARAIGAHRVDMARVPIGGYDARLAQRQLPPLIKAYLRVGAQVGEGAFVDGDFNSIDVFMLMPVARIAARYAERFVAAA